MRIGGQRIPSHPMLGFHPTIGRLKPPALALISDFEDADVEAGGLTAFTQITGSSVTRVVDPADAGNHVLQCVAAADDGSQVGKAYLSYSLGANYTRGARIRASFRMYVPTPLAADPDLSVVLDFENGTLALNPGVRLDLQKSGSDYGFRLERGKIGLSPMAATAVMASPEDAWVTVEVDMTLGGEVGDGIVGSCITKVNGAVVQSGTGATMLTSALAGTTIAEVVTKVQIGVTANSDTTDAMTILFDDFRLSASGPVLAEETIGALTLVGAGGRTIDAPDGTYGPYTVSGGTLAPNTAPVTPGAYLVGDIVVTAEADTYDVASSAEFADVLALGGGTIAGKTIKGLPGADLAGTSPGSSVSYPGTLTLAAPLVVTSRDPANPCFHRRANFRHNGTIRFKDMTIRDTYLLSDHFASSTVLQFSAPTSGRSKVILDNVTGTGGDVLAIDTSIVLQATAAAHTNGASTTTITLIGSPDLTSVATDRSMAVRLGSSNRIIIGKDNTAKTLTVDAAITIPLATPVDYIVCYVPQALSFIGQDGGISSRPDIEITGCNLSNFLRALTGGSGWNDFLVQTTEIDQNYNDHLQVIVIGDEARVDILRNRFRRAHGWYTDPLNPHVDGVQFVCMNMTSDNTVPYQIIGNQFWQDDGRAHDTQCIFIEGAPSGRRVLVTAEHNIGMTASAHGITIERPASGTVVRGNTLVLDNSGTDPQILYPTIDVAAGPSPVDDGVTVAFNASCAVNSSSALTMDNHTFGTTAGANDDTAYAAVFAGASGEFEGAGVASFAEFRAALTPDTTTLWPSNRVRRGAMSGYYDYTTGISDAPWDEDGWAASGGWGNLTGVTVGSAVTGTKRQITGVSTTGTSVYVTGGQSPTLTLYDTDGSTVLVSGVSSVLAFDGQWIEPHDTASGTGGTLVTVTISAGAAAAGSWTHETAAGYSVNAVGFDGTNDWAYLESGFSSGTGKQASIVFTLQMVGSWPATTGVIAMTATAGGFAQFTAETTSGGAITLRARNSSGTVIATWTAAPGTFAANTYYTIAAKLDTNTGMGWVVRIRPDGGSWSTPTASVNTFTVDGIMAACTRCRVGAANSTGASRIANAYLADLWLDIGTAIDFTDSAELAKFVPTVSKGTDGSMPTGAAPDLFMSGATGSWQTNKGTGGGLTLAGSLTTAPSAPT